VEVRKSLGAEPPKAALIAGSGLDCYYGITTYKSAPDSFFFANFKTSRNSLCLIPSKLIRTKLKQAKFDSFPIEISQVFVSRPHAVRRARQLIATITVKSLEKIVKESI